MVADVLRNVSRQEIRVAVVVIVFIGKAWQFMELDRVRWAGQMGWPEPDTSGPSRSYTNLNIAVNTDQFSSS